MYHSFFIHSSADGHLGCVHVLAFVDSDAVDTGVRVSLSVPVFSGYMPSGGIVVSDGSFIPLFLRILHTVLHSDCISLHFHQQFERVPFSPRCLQHLSFVGFLMVAVVTSIRSYLIVVLTCISLMMSRVVHLFMSF